MRQTDTTSRGRNEEAERSRRFQELALPHLDAAFNLARWLSGNASDADDIVQEAFMRAFRFFGTFRGDNARPWLLAIVRRTWYTEWRRRTSSREVAGFDDSHEEAVFDGWSPASIDPQALMIREEDARRVHVALEQLPVEYREVLILRELEELSYREIAIVADLPVGTVMSRLARGRRRLAVALAALEAHGSKAGGTNADDTRDRAPGARSARPDALDTPPSAWTPGGPGAAAAGANQEAPDGL